MAKENQLVTYLKNMKSKLKSQEMSVMVGAGFSKNVNSDLYPSWSQLLADMVLHMYGEKIEKEYEQIKPISKRPDHKKFIKDRINEYINETGPLKVASKYMDTHGYRESIDTYIEMRTPYIVTKGNQKYLRHFVEEKKIDLLLNDDDLSAHRKLVNLPWNNIYTTNYDNLLEKCINENIEGEILKQIDALEHAINELEENNITNNKKREGQIIESLDEKDSIIDDVDNSVSKRFIEPRKQDKKTQQLADHVALFRLDSEIGFISRQISLKEKELSRLRSLLKSCPSVVTRSSQLALKRTRNVIKLHGSRRTEENKIFGFDDDARKQYVITQDDFDTYPAKHEAFTQLMRISLLQESFCLIGFSGVDPNFLAWIGWVRDVLFKDKETNKSNFKEKIYLITASKESEKIGPDYGRSTFYENQRIANVPLLEDVCIDFLENETGKKLLDRSSRKGILKLLFDYLQSETFIPSPELAIEVSYRTKFNQICEALPHWGTVVTQEKINAILAELSSIDHLKQYNRFPSVYYPYDSKRQNFLEQVELYLPFVENDPQKLRIYLTAVSFFLKIQLYPQSVFYANNAKLVNKLTNLAKGISMSLYGEFLLLSLKDAIWYDKERVVQRIEKELAMIEEKDIIQERKYLIALYFLLRFKFDQLTKYLESWEAVDHWVIKKAGLLSHIDANAAKDLLLKTDVQIIQEHLYELELNRYLDYSSFQGDSQNWERYRFLKDSGLHTMVNSLDYLVNEIKEKEGKILPYGEGKHTISNGFTVTNTNKDLQGMQLIGLMLDSGFPFSTYDSNFASVQKVHQAMINTLKYRYLPVIQSALQFNDSKFAKRMAQDFVISPHDINVHQKICHYLQNAYLNKETPFRYKENILIFLAELINIVHPEKWEYFFIEVWSENLENLDVRLIRKGGRNEYLNKALALIQTPAIIGQVVRNGLELYPNQSVYDVVVQYLYTLAMNPFLKIQVTSVRPLIEDGFLKVIKSLNQSPGNIFLLGNMSILLSPHEKELIFAELKSVNFEKINNVRFWRIVLFFIKEDPAITKRIKDAILKSESLWYAGFQEGGVSRGDFISLRLLRKREKYPGIQWNSEEVIFIYKRLLAELKKITAFLKRRQDRNIFDDLLEEMLFFLKDESTILRHIPGYLTIVEEVNSNLVMQREFDDAFKGLISKEKNKVLWSLDEIVSEIKDFHDWSAIKIYLDILINKLLLQNLPAIEACLNALSYLIHEFKEVHEFERYKMSLIAILIQYRDYPLENGDESYIEERLVNIAFVLNEWEVQDEIVTYYLNLLKASRYNNVKFNLAAILSVE